MHNHKAENANSGSELIGNALGYRALSDGGPGWKFPSSLQQIKINPRRLIASLCSQFWRGKSHQYTTRMYEISFVQNTLFSQNANDDRIQWGFPSDRHRKGRLNAMGTSQGVKIQ